MSATITPNIVTGPRPTSTSMRRFTILTTMVQKKARTVLS
jgi:hypothetical protein